MSQRDGFTGGFIAGAVLGGVVGGILGTILASRQNNRDDSVEDSSLAKSHVEPKISTEESIEGARRSLEEKIAQLNLAIDDVRQQLGTVNGNSSE
ncbi:MAG: hypothetical protein QNJ54_12855 [Prochloraceae cyanobacterium]|nr:hypothetical protein [Prochloraceae cyanobacterium]